MKPFGLLVLCLLMAPSLCPAQKKQAPPQRPTPQGLDSLRSDENELLALADSMVNADADAGRLAAAARFDSVLVRSLQTVNSFYYPFPRLKTISIVTPPDSAFRLFTWQVFVNDSTYRYHGLLQANRPEPWLQTLTDARANYGVPPVQDVLDASTWYGCVYYAIKPFDLKEGRHYLVFGFDAHRFFNRRKVLDVLHFDADGRPMFGAPVFDRGNAEGFRLDETRIVLEYAAEASVRLNWDDQYQVVIYDHLIPMPSPYYKGMTYVPDGSYEAFGWDKSGKWVYVPKIFNDVNETVPFPAPILDQRKGKDIMGKEKKKKGKTP